ncbi:MAG: hypothetical protein AAB362_02985 [Patescibacteria group bacterium]
MENAHSISPKTKSTIMRKVYGVWLMRQVAPVMFFELPAIGILAFFAAKLIFVETVLTNMALSVNGVTDGIRFILMAFIHTQIETQIVLGLSIATGLFFVKDSTKSIRGLSFLLQ